MIKEIPILFSTPMVQAILEGRKTMTRRIVKPRSGNNFQIETAKFEPNAIGYYHNRYIQEIDEDERTTGKTVFCPFGKTETGSILWVRETWCNAIDEDVPYLYRATHSEAQRLDEDGSPWRPSIHMPKDASRIWLEVTDISVERLHDITEEDAEAEGVEKYHCRCGGNFGHYESGGYDNECECLQWPLSHHVMPFRDLWNSINGNWDQNPWVWVVSFKVLSTTGKPKQLETEEHVH